MDAASRTRLKTTARTPEYINSQTPAAIALPYHKLHDARYIVGALYGGVDFWKDLKNDQTDEPLRVPGAPKPKNAR